MILLEISNLKVILSHGTSDPVIPYAMGELMHTILKGGAGIE